MDIFSKFNYNKFYAFKPVRSIFSKKSRQQVLYEFMPTRIFYINSRKLHIVLHL